MIQKKEIKYLASLKQKKFRLINQEIIIEGSKLILDAIKNNQEIIKIIYCKKDETFSKIRSWAKEHNIPLNLCSHKDAEKISDTKNSQQIFALLKFKLPKKIDEIDLTLNNNIIVMDGISDPGNLGTILRTCSWFGYNNIMLSNECVEFNSPKTIRAAMGAHFYMKNIYKDSIQNIIKFLKQKKYEIIVADLNGTNLNKFKLKTKKWALILGNESKGISNDSINGANQIITIEGANKIESLNVAEACSIIMYYLFKK